MDEAERRRGRTPDSAPERFFARPENESLSSSRSVEVKNRPKEHVNEGQKADAKMTSFASGLQKKAAVRLLNGNVAVIFEGMSSTYLSRHRDRVTRKVFHISRLNGIAMNCFLRDFSSFCRPAFFLFSVLHLRMLNGKPASNFRKDGA